MPRRVCMPLTIPKDAILMPVYLLLLAGCNQPGLSEDTEYPCAVLLERGLAADVVVDSGVARDRFGQITGRIEAETVDFGTSVGVTCHDLRQMNQVYDERQTSGTTCHRLGVELNGGFTAVLCKSRGLEQQQLT